MEVTLPLNLVVVVKVPVPVVDVVVVVVVVVLGLQIRPDEPSNIPSLSAVEVTHTPQSVCTN